jgi:hypothetical protein
MKYVALLVLVVGCSKPKDKPKEAPPPAPVAPAVSPQSKPVVPVPDKLTFADGTPEADLLAFCVANQDKMMECFNDAGFWEVLSTLFFAQNLSLDDGTNERREAWIGMRKDDLAQLKKANKFKEDCEAGIRNTVWPTAEARAKVEAARKDSCPAFANAFGRMVFIDRAFHDRRPGL